MSSRKRHREEADDELDEAELELYADELPPFAKKVLKDEIGQDEIVEGTLFCTTPPLFLTNSLIPLLRAY